MRKTHVTRALFEIVSRDFIEREMFQNSGISMEAMLYLVNDLVKALSDQEKTKFNLPLAASIFYKELAGQPLTAEEQRYDAEDFHELNVVGEIFNGVRYAVGYVAASNLWASISSAVSNRLFSHLPAIIGSAAITYFGPYTLGQLVDRTLKQSNLNDKQKELLQPWLNSIGRLVISLTPRVSADAQGVHYTSPSVPAPVSAKLVQYNTRSALQYLMTGAGSLAVSSLAQNAMRQGGLKTGSIVSGLVFAGLGELSTASAQDLLVNTQGVTVATKHKKDGAPSVLSLSGSHEEMGYQYGNLMQTELQAVLAILKNYFITEHGVSYAALIAQANIFYNRYGYSYQQFLAGMAEGSGLTLDECNILNGMETLNVLVQAKSALSACAFLSIPASRSASNATLVGRNYDFPPPYDATANYLTITVLNEPNSVPTAFVAMAGQIYCPTCINANGIFAEFNNGMPSGGYVDRLDRQTLLSNLMLTTQSSSSLAQLTSQMMATQSDYSLIVNAASPNETQSFEFSATLGMMPFSPDQQQPFASTNFYLNTSWQGLPIPTDNTTWIGVTRRANLLNLANQLEQADIPAMQTLMDTKIEDGGAVWNFTIYQVIFNSADLSLYVKVTQQGTPWFEIPLSQYFNSRVVNLSGQRAGLFNSQYSANDPAELGLVRFSRK